MVSDNADNGGADTNTLIAKNGVTQGVFIVLVVFALIGVIITDISPSDAHGYWILTLGIFALAAIYCGWKTTDLDGKRVGGMVVKQIIHWFGATVAILCVYALLHTGSINYEEAGSVMLLVLALATFLAGTHVGWRFYLLGMLLAVAMVTAAYIEEFMWIILLVAIAVIVVTLYFSRRKAA